MSKSHGHYSIRYAGLSEGSHEFIFDVHEDFFKDYYPETEILGADIKLQIRAEKSPSMLMLELIFSGNISVECDRCLDPCTVPVSAVQKLIFTASDDRMQNGKIDDTMIAISPESDSVMLDEYVYDFILLSLPLRRVHDENEGTDSACNQEMLERINTLQNEKKTDPRWEKLNQIKYVN